MEVKPRYMLRALQLAKLGRETVSPNPMVGAVIVDSQGTIIGEGWHRKWGEGHAEVNAVASVKDKSLLHDCTMYVTLEPCSHYGKTPPCAELIIRSGIPRVVVGCLDPFEKVAGRGIAMLREAGVEVTAPFMEDECRALNRRFMTAHTTRRPYILLKYAMSADGFIDTATDTPSRWSSPTTSLLVHALRARYDAIMIGSGTVLHDNPRLNVRIGQDGITARRPRPVILDHRGRVTGDYRIFSNATEPIVYRDGELTATLSDLYSRGITSVMVEGGAMLLHSIIEAGLWDEARVEISPLTIRQMAAMDDTAPLTPAQKVMYVGLPTHGTFTGETIIDNRRIVSCLNAGIDLP